LPEDVRGILFKLAEREETDKHVALAIALNINELPEHVKNLLDKLKPHFFMMQSKNLLQAIGVNYMQ